MTTMHGGAISDATIGARKAVILGPDELAEGLAVVRAMATGEEVRIPLDRLTE